MKIDNTNQPDWSKNVLMPKNNKRRSRKQLYVQGRLVNSVQYAISWGVLNKIWYAKDLKKKSKQSDAPSYAYIIKTWKGFANYYRALVKVGMQPRIGKSFEDKRKVYDEQKKRYVKSLLKQDYDIPKFVAQAGIKNRTDYRQYRKKHPELKQFLPSDGKIRALFGTFSMFFYEVEKYNVDLLITRYVEQSVKAGHWLYLKECDELNLDIRYAMNLLRPYLFNTFCYRKLQMLGLSDKLKR